MACEVRFRTRADLRCVGAGATLRRMDVDPGTTLLEAVRGAGLPIARACGGGGLCGRCGLRILAGAETLAPETPAEVRAKAANRIDPALRLACRVLVRGPLEVSAAYW